MHLRTNARRGTLVTLGLIAFTLSPAFGDVVFSDNFATENGGVPILGTQTLSKFNVLAGNVDLIGSSNGQSSYDFYPGHGLYLDLDGTGCAGCNNATLATKQVFGPGSYSLSFLLGNNPGGGSTINTLAVSLGSFSQSFTTTNPMPFTPELLNFTTATGGSLMFVQGGPSDQQGSILGDITLTQTPEPSSYMLLGLAILGTAVLQVRNRRLGPSR